MSNKQDKKIRRVVRKNMKVELKDVGLSLQTMIIGFGLRKRATIAWNILRGQPFLNTQDLKP